jgi:peptidoglycan/xylan/chitin deacetylase (PgdA/CDA1 family)
LKWYSYFHSSSKNNCVLAIILVVLSAASINDWSFHHSITALKSGKGDCHCVIFRFDDIRNGYLEKIQTAMMDFFISKNVTVSFGLIASQISDNSELLKKLNHGYKIGLFEVGVHGWNHEDYSALTEEQQKISFQKANEKLKQFFGKYPELFIPPYNLFNNNTISAMKNSQFRILSSAIYYDEPDLLKSTRDNLTNVKRDLIHMPEMTDFSIYYNGTWVKAPVRFLLGDIDNDIQKYGYSVVMIHPHNFATQVNGTLTDILDLNQLQSLSSFIEIIKNKNIPIVTFSDAAATKGEIPSNFRNLN